MRIEILAHRGWWRVPTEKNSVDSFHRAFAGGYGVETDIRDCDGTLVISHDMPDSASALTLAAFLDIHDCYPARPMLALNIKADGLAQGVQRMLQSRGVKRYFVFDMSVPDSLAYFRAGLRVFTRWSDYEAPSPLDLRADGIWLDAFDEPFVPAARLDAALRGGRMPALVSPELHGKPHHDAWHQWRDVVARSADGPVTLLCTDLPDKASAFFGAGSGAAA